MEIKDSMDNIFEEAAKEFERRGATEGERERRRRLVEELRGIDGAPHRISVRASRRLFKTNVVLLIGVSLLLIAIAWLLVLYSQKSSQVERQLQRITDLETQLHEKKKQLAAADARVEELQEKIEAERAKLEAAQNRLNETHDRLIKSNDRLIKSYDLHSALVQSVLHERGARAMAEDDLARTKLALKQEQAELGKAREDVASLRSELERQVAEHSTQVRQYRKRLVAAQDDRERLNRELAVASAKLAEQVQIYEQSSGRPIPAVLKRGISAPPEGAKSIMETGGDDVL